MRLIDTEDHELHEFVGDAIPIYAILSHTWDEHEEVTYQDFVSKLNAHKKGWPKIKKTCELARNAGIRYAWVDTCCIDKTSSAELSEAINSMYRWYEESQVCFAFLTEWSADVEVADSMQRCRWFMRGWTLQELIAPKNITFFDSVYNIRGSKVTLIDTIHQATSIDEQLLLGRNSLAAYSIAQKMSWAVSRQTKRTQDEAYSLLGIFDLNMLLLYGEGAKAFRRLQEEIIRSNSDLSIFAWKLPPRPEKLQIGVVRDSTLCIVLAMSPTDFAGCGETMGEVDGLRDLSMSNIGVKIMTRMHLRCVQGSKAVLYVLPVAYSCGRFLGIRLRQIGHKQYHRENPYSLDKYLDLGSIETVPPVERYLLTKIPGYLRWSMEHSRFASTSLILSKTRAFVLQFSLSQDLIISEPWPLYPYDHLECCFFGPHNSRRDFGTINFLLNAAFPDDPTVTTKLKCQFIALGWYNSANDARFSLIEASMYTDQLASIQTWVTD
ncbi:heterokaryon incompatibility protein-domain-containing protein [Paraphoma chrysanthemicola]|nr:heterokaryon incompatibility protein-domain-containing protein [Paraphoma chrysanthemicola]